MPHLQTILGLTAIAMTIWAHIPYLMTTIKGENRPHIFTWIIWTLLTFIAFAVQWTGGAGIGAWVTGVTGILCVIITASAFRQGDKNITRLDWFMFLGGMLAIPLWALTDTPLLSIIIVTLIDCSAFGPTFRKSWHKPHEENSFMYGFNIPRHVCSLFSIANFTFITAVYPAALLVMNVIMYAMLKLRRRVRMKHQDAKTPSL